jgi:LmbE family N-acetylglucosaminyl deacetylase
MFTYSDVFSEKKNVLIVTAHPDDTLVYFGALIYKLRQENINVYTLVVTNGARGSRENTISEVDLAKQRMLEEQTALSSLGVPEENVFCLGYMDGEVESDMKLIGEISKYIRKFKIDIVCSHEPSIQYAATYAKNGFFVQHRDHRKVGEAVIDAAYPFSRDRSFFAEHYVEGIEPHTLYDVLLTDEKDCNFEFEYTEQLDVKKAAMRLHKSQFNEESINEINDAFKFGDKYMERFHYLKLLW